jgi:hypothetical protein
MDIKKEISFILIYCANKETSKKKQFLKVPLF